MVVSIDMAVTRHLVDSDAVRLAVRAGLNVGAWQVQC
jgi:hypothetical protein